jgi:hypothetical protein
MKAVELEVQQKLKNNVPGVEFQYDEGRGSTLEAWQATDPSILNNLGKCLAFNPLF